MCDPIHIVSENRAMGLAIMVGAIIINLALTGSISDIGVLLLSKNSLVIRYSFKKFFITFLLTVIGSVMKKRLFFQKGKFGKELKQD